MYFLLASLVALGGIFFLLRSTKPRIRKSDYYPDLIDTNAWIDSLEFSLQKFLRKILKVTVVHMVSWYRFIVYDITIHKTLRQKVRELIQEHQREYREKKKNEVK